MSRSTTIATPSTSKRSAGWDCRSGWPGPTAARRGCASALAAGAAGVQVGTAFAFCAESGLADKLKRQVLRDLVAGDVAVRTDWRVSPTGFPFKVLDVAGTLSDPDVLPRRTGL